MLPTLRPGEWWLARRTQRVMPGDLVVFDHPDVPGLIAVKRAVWPEVGGWWVEGDNAPESTDSRSFGILPMERVLGTLKVRYRTGFRDRESD